MVLKTFGDMWGTSNSLENFYSSLICVEFLLRYTHMSLKVYIQWSSTCKILFRFSSVQSIQISYLSGIINDYPLLANETKMECIWIQQNQLQSEDEI